MDTPTQTFGQRLRALREALGWSQPACAKFLDVAPRTLHSWEKDDPKRTPLEVTQEGVIARMRKGRPS